MPSFPRQDCSSNARLPTQEPKNQRREHSHMLINDIPTTISPPFDIPSILRHYPPPPHQIFITTPIADPPAPGPPRNARSTGSAQLLNSTSSSVPRRELIAALARGEGKAEAVSMVEILRLRKAKFYPKVKGTGKWGGRALSQPLSPLW